MLDDGRRMAAIEFVDYGPLIAVVYAHDQRAVSFALAWQDAAADDAHCYAHASGLAWSYSALLGMHDEQTR